MHEVTQATAHVTPAAATATPASTSISTSTDMMSRLAAVGRVFYAVAMVAFGLLQIGYGDFVTRVVPWWPTWIPGRPIAAVLIGALLAAAGAALLLNLRTATVATLLACGLLLSFVLLDIPLMLKDALLGGSWTMAGKVLGFCGGALLIAQAASPASPGLAALPLPASAARLGVCFFAAFLILCGIQHFIYIDFVMTLVPAWIPPGARFWSYAAGIFLIAGGVGLIVPATARLAGLLSGLMIFCWVFLVHIPRAAATFPQTTNEMTAVFEAVAMAGIAWLATAWSASHPAGWSRP